MHVTSTLAHRRWYFLKATDAHLNTLLRARAITHARTKFICWLTKFYPHCMFNQRSRTMAKVCLQRRGSSPVSALALGNATQSREFNICERVMGKHHINWSTPWPRLPSALWHPWPHLPSRQRSPPVSIRTTAHSWLCWQLKSVKHM
jgi:hypothetical protein